MNRLFVKIKDDNKIAIVLNLLRELPFVEIEDDVLKMGKKDEKKKRDSGLEDLFGIWEHRKITINDIREKAWKRS